MFYCCFSSVSNSCSNIQPASLLDPCFSPGYLYCFLYLIAERVLAPVLYLLSKGAAKSHTQKANEKQKMMTQLLRMGKYHSLWVSEILEPILEFSHMELAANTPETIFL